MDSSDSSKPAPPGKPQKRKGGRAGEDAFDLWLQRGLHQLYDNVAAEPIPPELMRLIEEDRTRRGK
ncbi:hypothetical protein [Falsiroseomonas selenitidurans]|uniref:Anti-sigma factor NepR domain-containing protein n=1 Tax=Falsiroseomonas selenitidurans TaxID=2716335 RepID=A0ABX1E784_9PROT|nr:hypothetical protein [Falsiroseomonas selenitidurans]NKC33050.1 hypothetical protein [Falsiroseomonas selenitidurans]